MPAHYPFLGSQLVYDTSLSSNTCVSVAPLDYAAVGDLALFFCSIDGTGSVPTAPAGWTLISLPDYDSFSQSIFIFYRVLTSGDTSAVTLTHSFGATSVNYMHFIKSGTFDATTPIDGATSVVNTSTPNKVSCPSLTPSEKNCTLISAYIYDGDRKIQPATVNFTHVMSVKPSSINQMTGFGYSVIQDTSATDPVEFYAGGVSSDDGLGVSILIKDSSPTAPTHSPTIPNGFPAYNLIAQLTGTTAIGTGETYRDPTANGLTSIPALGAVEYRANSATDAALKSYLTCSLLNVDNGATNPVEGFEVSLGASVDMSAAGYMLSFDVVGGFVPGYVPTAAYGGAIIVLRSSDTAGPTYNWKAYRFLAQEGLVLSNFRDCVLLEVNDLSAYEIDSSGTLDTSDITQISFFSMRTLAGDYRIYFSNAKEVKTLTLAGGSSADPIKLSSFFDHSQGFPMLGIGQQGDAQTLAFWPLAIGASGESAYFSDSAFSLSFASQTDESNGIFGKHFSDNSLGLEIALEDSGFNPTVVMTSSSITGISPYYFNIKDYTTTSSNITLTLNGLLISGPGTTEIDYWPGQVISGVTFVDRDLFDYTASTMAGNFDDCIFDNTPIKISSEAQLGKLNNCFLKNGAAALTIVGDQAGTWSDPGITVSNNTYDIEYNGSTNFTLQSAVPLTVNNLGAGVLTIDAPTFDLTLNSSEAGTLLQIFATGTQTIIDSTTGSTLAYTHSSETVDVVAQKSGFLPQRQTGIALSGNVAINFNLVADPIYDGGHGLTYTTDSSYNRTSQKLTNTTRNEGRAIYSLMVDAFIAQATLRNTAFPLQAIGPNLFAFVDDAEMIDATSEDNWKGAGYRYINSSDVVTKEAASFKLSGVPSGATALYQQVDGSGETSARASGNVDEVVQIYGDATHGNIDYRGHMVWKTLVNGETDGFIDIVNGLNSGLNLEPFEYIASFVTEAMDITLGDPGLTITVADQGATPASHFGKNFSIVITDNAVQSAGEDIVRELNYNKSQPGTYQGKARFNWPQLATKIGSTIETVRGYTEGAQSSTLKGVVVLLNDGVTAHPDFSRFQADDGSYYTVPVLSSISITGMPTAGANIRLQVRNVTAQGASAWQATTAYALGDKVLRTTGVGTEQTAGLYFVATTAGTTGGTEPTWDTTVGNATVDGSVTWTCYAVLFYDAAPGASGYSATYINGQEFADGDAYLIRFAELNAGLTFKTAEANGIASVGGFSVALSIVDDAVYTINGVDGSSLAVTNKFGADFANDEIDLDANQDFTATEAFAFFCYTLTSTDGMYQFWGGVTAIDAANYRINSAILNLFFDETAGFVKQTDGARIYRSDGTRPARDPTTGGNGIEINWRNPVYGYDAGGGGFTAGDRASIDAILADTADMQPKLGTPAVDISADIASSSAPSAAAIRAEIDANSTQLAAIIQDTGTTLPTQISALPTAPSAATIRAEIDASSTQLSSIQSKLGVPSVSLADDIASLNDVTGPQVADAILARSIGGGADGGRTIQDALRANRNRVVVDREAGTVTVYAEDDTTIAWQGTLTTEVGDAIAEVNPA